MEFFIKKNATLPLLKMQVVKDGRSDFNKMMELIENSSIFFSMIDIETGVPKITTRPAGFVSKTFIDPNSDPEYYIYYQFSNKDTKKIGRYEGQFLLRNEDGVLILPIRDKLYINIQESFIADDLPYDSCYVSEFPCCITTPIIPIVTTTTTIEPPCPSCPVCTPTPTPTLTQTPTPTPTPTETPAPFDDFTYILIPGDDTEYEFLTGITITLEAEVSPGSVILHYTLTSNQVMSSGLTMNYTHKLGLVTGGTVDIESSTTIPVGGISGESTVVLSEYNYSDLNGNSNFTNTSFNPSGYSITLTNKITNFQVITPTPTPTLTQTPTPTPTPTETPIPLGNVNLLVLGDENSPTLGSALQTRLNELNYTCNLTTITMSTTYDGNEINVGSYDVVVLYTNSFQTGSSNLSSNLENFVNNGGGLVTGTFLWNIYPLGFNFDLTPWVGGVGQVNDITGDFTILSPTVILDGINSPIGFTLINNLSTPQSGTIINASYNNSGYGFLTTREYGLSRQVGINAFLGFITNFNQIELRNVLANSILWSAKLIDPPPPTPTPTPTLTPTPSAAQMVPVTIYIGANGESVTFDGVTYTSDTTIDVLYNVYYNVTCNPQVGYSFVGWNGYGVAFSDGNSQTTQAVTFLLSGSNFIPSYVILPTPTPTPTPTLTPNCQRIIVVPTLWDGNTTINSNVLQLTETLDTLQIQVGDIITDNNLSTSTVGTTFSDGTYTYIGTGPGGTVAFNCQFPLTFSGPC